MRHPLSIEPVAMRPIVDDVTPLRSSTPSGTFQTLEPRRTIGGPS